MAKIRVFLLLAFLCGCDGGIRDEVPPPGRTAIIFEVDGSVGDREAALLEQFARLVNGDEAAQEVSFQTAQGVSGLILYRATRVSSSFDEDLFWNNLHAWKEIHGVDRFSVNIIKN